jgi:protein arginine N-methyltransferase 3
MSYRVPFNAEPQDDSGSSSGEEDRLSDWASSLGEALQTKSLFSDRTFPNPTAAIEFDTKGHGFSIKDESTKKGLDLYGRMRLINWIRREVSCSQKSQKLKLMDRELVLKRLKRWMGVTRYSATMGY